MQKTPTRGRYYFLGFIILVACCMISILFFNSQSDESPLADSNIYTVAEQDVLKGVTISGNLTGQANREIYFPAGSKVLDATVSVGATVDAGDLVAEVETTNQFGETEVIEITTPIAGTITERNYLDLDTVVNAAVPGFEVTDVSDLLVEVYVSESDAIQVRKGQVVQITYPAYSVDDIFSGKVQSVDLSPAENQTGVSYRALIAPDTIPDSVKLGMSVDAEIITDREDNVLAIPDSYIIDDGNTYKVKLIVGEAGQEKVVEQAVELGLRTDELTEINAGLIPGDRIVEPDYSAERTFGF